MSIVVIPREMTEKELEALAKSLKPPEKPKPPPKPRGWAAYHAWREANDPLSSYEPPPLLTPEQLSEFRKSKGWLQKNLAKRTGYSLHSIKNMESGFVKVSPMLSSMIYLLMELDDLKEENDWLKTENVVKAENNLLKAQNKRLMSERDWYAKKLQETAKEPA